MTIRARMALLALVAILSVIAVLVTQYRFISREEDRLLEQKSAYMFAQQQSSLIHVLQKERGLTAAVLTNPSEKRSSELQRQYAETDAMLASVQPDGLQQQLAAMRKQVAARQIGWEAARMFYTQQIDDALDRISASVASDKSTHALMHMAIVELAWGREDLGLLRATMNRIYSGGSSDLADVILLAEEYGKFKGHLRAFSNSLRMQGNDVSQPSVMVQPYAVVISQIEEVLQRGPHASWARSNALWWSDATRVIDNFKSAEDSLYGLLFKAADKEIALKKQELHRYGMIAISLGLLMALLTALTIARILRALGVLIATLDEVVRSENYSIRINGESPKDEFGRISLSLNNLLDFTDTLITDKEKLAATDLLTGIMNRRSFLEAAKREIARGDRYDSHFTLVFLDIDFFKQINDTFGHASGDETLVHFAQVLRAGLRDADLLARWGGEEFVVLAPLTDLEQGKQFAGKLCEAVASANFHEVGKVTCSIGVAERKPGETFDALCQRADMALYQAKAEGRNRVCWAG